MKDSNIKSSNKHSEKELDKSHLKASKEKSNLYMSKLAEPPSQDRLRSSNIKNIHKSRSKESGIKLSTNDIVTIRQQKIIKNSSANNAVISGFEGQQFQNKNFKKFSIQAVITQKNLVKESNYFDESRLGDEPAKQEQKFGGQLTTVAKPSLLNFNIGNFEQFQMFQVKTYLFNRNLKSKIIA